MKAELIRFNFTSVEVISEDVLDVPYDGGCTVTPINKTFVNFFIFGGTVGSTNCTSSLWSFSSDSTHHDPIAAKSNGWRVWDLTGPATPEARSGAGLVAYNSTILYMFGGSCGTVFSGNELWKADLVANTWSIVELPPESKRPSPRTGHAFALDFTAPAPHQLLVFGGIHDNVTLGDVWRFDINTSTWSELIFNTSTPSPRYSFGFSFAGGRLALFGGAGSENLMEPMNNEVWQLVLNDDCLSSADCEECVVNRLGCGWCSPNPPDYKCVAGAGFGPFLNTSCMNNTATQWTSEFSTCPLDQFPGWIIALVIIGCIVLVGTIIYFVMRRSSSVAGYETVH